MPKEGFDSYLNELAMVSHEFRRPIDIISKSAELVNLAAEKNTLDMDKLREIMDGIINNCARLSHLTTQILSIAHIEYGGVRILSQAYNLTELLRDLEAYTYEYQALKDVRFVFKTKLSDPYMETDFRKLERIVLNLISNAVKYSKSTNRKITISVTDRADAVSFSVKDNGIGIPPEEHEHIFEKFYRVGDFQTRSTEGCGLGLSMVKGYTELLGGTITLRSQPGKGSEFTVTLPRRAQESKPFKIVEQTQGYQLFKSTVHEIFADI